MSQLPQGWETVYFKDAIEIIRGVTFSKQDRGETSAEGYIPCLRTSNIQETIEVDDLAYIPVQLVKQKDRFIRPDDIIISMSNSRELVGKVAKADASLNGFTYGAFLSVLRSSKFNPDFLYYLLRSPRVQHEMRLTAGQTVNIANLSISGMSKIQLPLPPIAEQRRIVARLDSLLAQSKAARAELNKALALAKRQRQAVLAKAFSGELTQDWRDKQLFPSQTLAFTRDGIDGRVSEFNELPSHWSWTSINEVFVISGGLTKNSKRNNLPIRVPYLRVANVYANELRLSEIENIGCTETELTKTVLQKGDLLIVEGNGSIDQLGRVALWNNEIDRCSHQNHLIRARPTSIVLPKYGLFWLLSPEGRNYIEKVGSSSSGLHTLSISKVGGLPIPMCSLEEQKEIVKRIEAAFAQIETMENEAKKALALAERLEQATLAKAFQGQL